MVATRGEVKGGLIPPARLPPPHDEGHGAAALLEGAEHRGPVHLAAVEVVHPEDAVVDPEVGSAVSREV